MDISKIYDQLKIDEGTRNVVYVDTTGNPTAGTGHKLVGTELTDYPVGSTVPDEVIEAWFVADVARAIDAAEKVPAIPFYAQPDAVQDSLVNMVYNMGPGGVEGFPHFLACLRAHDYAGAAHELETSLWAQQVGARANRIIEAIRGAVAV